MTNKFESKTYSLSQHDSCICCGNSIKFENNYESILRKKYNIPNNYQVVIKQGAILSKDTKPYETPKNKPLKLKQLALDYVKSDIDKIYGFIETASDEIYDLVQFGNNKLTPNDPVFHLHVELITENMFANLSSTITALPQKLYKHFLIRLNENSDDKIDLQLLNSQILPDNEIYGIINSSLENLKTSFFDNIDSIFDELNDSTQKGFFSDIWDGIVNFFNEIGKKIDQLIQNIFSRIQTETKKIEYQLTGFDKYEIVLSESENTCEKCQHMAGSVYRLDSLQIGLNAPPFHPNCRCTISGTYDPAPMTLTESLDTYDREAAVAYALEWAHNFNPDYPNFSKGGGDCANFISQCLTAAGFEMNGDWYCESSWDPRALYNPNYNWNWSKLWSGAKEQYEYLKNSNIISEEVVITSVDQITDTINNSEIKVGDIMYLKFDQDRPHHATIISKIEDGMIFYAAHSNGRDDYPLWQFFNEHKDGSAHILKIK